MESIRVRNVLSMLDASARTKLNACLPPTTMPDVPDTNYPSALLSVLNDYSLLGCVTEEILRYPIPEITFTNLCVAIQKWYPAFNDAHKHKIQTSKTTAIFLNHIIATRFKLNAVLKGTLVFDTTVHYGSVEGHPDAQTETQLFEVKMTGLMKKNWKQFLFQIFAYGAIYEMATDLYLVFPLQEIVWHADIRGWVKRTEFRDCLNTVAKRSLEEQPKTKTITNVPGLMLQEMFRIGNHVQKAHTLAETIEEFHGLRRPFQIFLAGNQNTKLNIKDDEIAKAAQTMITNPASLYIHSPYIINLCADPKEKNDYGTNLLIKNLQIGVAVGFRGVVVHVGKSTNKELAIAMKFMRTNIQRALEYATPSCPILLETPAGQGTEVLTECDAFIEFVKSFQSEKIRICVDTCHVFTCGHNPLEYIQKAKPYLKLVHFNDSATKCGACVDRHAFIGTGEIGITALTGVAEFCASNGVPMLVE